MSVPCSNIAISCNDTILMERKHDHADHAADAAAAAAADDDDDDDDGDCMRRRRRRWFSST